jgi:hypothetical protein
MSEGAIGLGLVEIAFLRMLLATLEATYKAAYDGDGINVAVSGFASAAIIAVALSAVVLPGLWLNVYTWMVGHTFGSPR